MSDSTDRDIVVPIAKLRAHADLGLTPAVGDAMVERLRTHVRAPHPRAARMSWRGGIVRVTWPRGLGVAVPSVLAVLVGLGLATGLTGGSSKASAASLFAALRQPAGAMSGADNSELQKAQAANPGLQIAAARQVLSDATVTLWLMPATNGDVCIVEQPTAAGGVIPGHPDMTLVGPGVSCTSATQAATQGVFAGVPGPGRWYYGVAPDGVTQVQATVNGQSVSLPLTNGGFRVPPAATSVTVGNTEPMPLSGS
jgi:hypothetical protein